MFKEKQWQHVVQQQERWKIIFFFRGKLPENHSFLNCNPHTFTHWVLITTVPFHLLHVVSCMLKYRQLFGCFTSAVHLLWLHQYYFSKLRREFWEGTAITSLPTGAPLVCVSIQRQAKRELCFSAWPSSYFHVKEHLKYLPTEGKPKGTAEGGSPWKHHVWHLRSCSYSGVSSGAFPGTPKHGWAGCWCSQGQLAADNLFQATNRPFHPTWRQRMHSIKIMKATWSVTHLQKV